MAKNANLVALKDESLELTYSLSELPTSQHRAGLVGLVVMMMFIREEGVPERDARIVCLNSAGAAFHFTKRGMQALFDTVYAATKGTLEVDKPFKREGVEVEPQAKRTEEITVKGKKQKKTVYVYERTVPVGAFLPMADPVGDDGPWLKLWRDMLWAIPRGVPATRRPFDLRANGEAATDASELFDLLRAAPNRSLELASTYYLGAQANTADNVTFTDVAQRQFLLHFWQYAAEIFVPQTTTREGKLDHDGFVFVFPDVADLETYCNEYRPFLQSRDKDKAGFLPKGAVIDLPGEAGLRTFSRLGRFIQGRAQQSTLVTVDDLIVAVDVIHARKDRNNVRILKQQRLKPKNDTMDMYEACVRIGYWSNIFKRQLLENILTERPLYTDFDRLISTQPTDLTIDDSRFAHDARLAFKEKFMSKDEDEFKLPELIYSAVRAYVGEKMKTKYGMSWTPELRNRPRDLKEYHDKKTKLTREASLAVRSRTGADFIEYVSTTLFSVAQFSGKYREANYVKFSEALLNQTDTVRTLVMLALAAQMPRQANTKTDLTAETEGS